jgi:ribulose-phosphate 3-epimerase
MSLLAPSILAADFSNLANQIRAVEIGSADLIHCDIMDGKFVPNITFGPKIVSTVRKLTKLPLDVHLMIENPQNFINDFANAGANFITIHQEGVYHLDRVLNSIKELNIKCGIALNPGTPVEAIFPVLHLADLVLVMSVNPGFGGQKFIEYTLEKIKLLRKIREAENHNYKIEVDGGINSKNIQLVKNAGTDIIVAGTSVFKNEDITAAATELKNLII